MTNYKTFVSFEPAQWLINRDEDSDKFKLSGDNLDAVKQAFEEISSTIEGAHLIELVASKASDGKINAMYDRDGFTLAYTPNDFFLGQKDSSFKYENADEISQHDMSIQRLVYHELQHIALDHKGISIESEAEAVTATNDFMTKYYSEPARNEDTSRFSVDILKGTPEWDINPNFDQEKAADYRNNTLLQKNGQPVLDGHNEAVKIGRDFNDDLSVLIDPNKFNSPASGEAHINTSLNGIEPNKTEKLSGEFHNAVAENNPNINTPNFSPTTQSYSFG